MKRGYVLNLVKEFIERKNEVYFVTGFQGFGAVGFLATRYIVSKLGMELIGYIDTPTVPDFTSVEDYGFSMPHEVFYRDIDKDKGVLVLLNRVNPEKKYMSSFVNEVLTLLRRFNVMESILIGGLDSRLREGDEEYRWFKTLASKRVLNAPYFVKGAYVVGPLASLLIAFQHQNIPAVVVLPYTQPDTIDHKAAAVAVKVLSSMLNTEIDISELLSYAAKVEEIEKMVQELYEQQIRRKESVMHT